MTQILYGALGGSSTTSDLYTIDPVTGVATSIGPIGHAITGLAFDPTTGRLYGATNNNSAANPRSLIEIDPVTGATISVLGQFSAGGSQLFSDIDFDSAGQLYGQATFTVPGGTAPRQVCKIDKTDASITPLLGSVNIPNVFFAIDRSIDLGYLCNFHNLFDCVLSTGSESDLGAISGLSPDLIASAASFDEVGLLWIVNAQDGLMSTLDVSTRAWSAGPTTTVLMDGLAWGLGASPPPPPSPIFGRFYEGFPWRFLFTKVDVTDPDNPVVLETTTWATDLLSNRQVSMALGASTSIEADVWPDDFRVNGIYDDDLPRIAQTKRMVLAFRREGSYVDPNQPGSNGPWHIKAIGQLLSPSDDGGPDVPVTHFVAYDSRTYLGARPAMMADGSLPDPQNGFLAIDTGDQVALAMLKNTIVNEGGVFIDAGVAYGGTAFYSGTIETTGDVAMTISAGQSVADVWDALEQAGNCDIILTAIYDPINRPGYTHEVSIYNLAGDDKYEVVMGWDELNHCINEVQRVHDGTPGNFFDKVQAYAGQGGVPVPAAGPLVNAAAVTAFGSWWLLQFFPSMLSTDPTASAVFLLATQALELAKQGRRTLTINVITQLAPIVLRAYGLGDRINIHATDRLRASLDGLQRVQAIPIQIPDDGVGEQLAALLTSPDYRSAPGT